MPRNSARNGPKNTHLQLAQTLKRPFSKAMLETDSTELRRSKRTRKTPRKQYAEESLAGEFPVDDLSVLVNQLPREQLEKLVIMLADKSADCGSLIRREISDGNLAKPVTHFPTKNMGVSGLGNLGKLPNELIIEILRYLSLRQLLVVTSQVCKALQDFRWLQPLWMDIDTDEIPYMTLFETILPPLSKKLPGCIKNANIVYKTNSIPKAEKLLNILARFHELESLKLTQRTAPLNHRKLDAIRKLAEDFHKFRHIKQFSMEIPMELLRDHSIVQAERAIDLVAYWPQLQKFSISMPGGRDRLTTVYMRRLSETGSLVKDGPKIMAKNYITSLSFTGGMVVDAEVFLHMGNFFPELRNLQITQVADYSNSLDNAIDQSTDYDALIPKLPRLKTCEVCFRDAKHGKANASSVLFFGIMKAAPHLEKLIYQAGDQCYDRVKLFSSIRKWKPEGSWKGVKLPKLKHLVMRDWAIEWKLLSYKGANCEFPSMEKTEAPYCISVETSDLVKLLKNGGR